MKLLVNTKDVLDYIVYDNENDIAHLQGAVHAELEDWAHEDLRVSFGITIFGAEAPERVALVARDWNDVIRQTLATKMTAAKVSGEEALPLDSDLTHDLYLAARAADGKFSIYGDCGILADNGCGYNTFSTVLTDKQLAQVEESPKDWVILMLQVN